MNAPPITTNPPVDPAPVPPTSPAETGPSFDEVLRRQSGRPGAAGASTADAVDGPSTDVDTSVDDPDESSSDERRAAGGRRSHPMSVAEVPAPSRPVAAPAASAMSVGSVDRESPRASAAGPPGSASSVDGAPGGTPAPATSGAVPSSVDGPPPPDQAADTAAARRGPTLPSHPLPAGSEAAPAEPAADARPAAGDRAMSSRATTTTGESGPAHDVRPATSDASPLRPSTVGGPHGVVAPAATDTTPPATVPAATPAPTGPTAATDTNPTASVPATASALTGPTVAPTSTATVLAAASVLTAPTVAPTPSAASNAAASGPPGGPGVVTGGAATAAVVAPVAVVASGAAVAPDTNGDVAPTGLDAASAVDGVADPELGADADAAAEPEIDAAADPEWAAEPDGDASTFGAGGRSSGTASTPSNATLAGAGAIQRVPAATHPPATGGGGEDLSAAARTFEGASAAEQMRRADVQRLAGLTRLGVDVATEQLGHVRIEAAGRAGDLQMNLTADDAGARAALGERLPELREQLRASGLELTSLDVSTAGGGRRGQGGVQGDGATPVERDDRDVDDGRGDQGESTPTAAITGEPRPADGRVDLRL